MHIVGIGGSKGCGPRSIFSIFMQFLATTLQSKMLADPLWELAPPFRRKILDPPLAVVIHLSHHIQVFTNTPGAYPGFPTGGDTSPRGEGAPTYDFATFCEKLHGIEKILGRRGGVRWECPPKSATAQNIGIGIRGFIMRKQIILVTKCYPQKGLNPGPLISSLTPSFLS